MAQKVRVLLVDDLDGTEMEEGEGHTVGFALDGASYEIDLTSENADRLRNALASYVTSGRPVGRSTHRSKGLALSSSGPSASDIREWAQRQGIEVIGRGRIAAEVRESYDAAH